MKDVLLGRGSEADERNPGMVSRDTKGLGAEVEE
jgi:hypothetical protein